jgi:hypothetical protein
MDLPKNLVNKANAVISNTRNVIAELDDGEDLHYLLQMKASLEDFIWSLKALAAEIKEESAHQSEKKNQGVKEESNIIILPPNFTDNSLTFANRKVSEKSLGWMEDVLLALEKRA